MERPILKMQEIPFNDPASNNFFQPTVDKPFVATFPAIEVYGKETIQKCLVLLQDQAKCEDGLNYLQVFDDPDKRSPLWVIEEQQQENKGKITALLPQDY